MHAPGASEIHTPRLLHFFSYFDCLPVVSPLLSIICKLKQKGRRNLTVQQKLSFALAILRVLLKSRKKQIASQPVLWYDNSNTKVVSVMVSATPVTHTSYVWIETRNGTVISGLSQATTSLGHGVVAKKTKVATSVGSIDMYAMGTKKYSDVTYVGSTTIFGG